MINEPKCPKELALALGIYVSHVGPNLAELEERDLVVCLNPALKKGRTYDITEKGREMAQRTIEAG